MKTCKQQLKRQKSISVSQLEREAKSIVKEKILKDEPQKKIIIPIKPKNENILKFKKQDEDKIQKEIQGKIDKRMREAEDLRVLDELDEEGLL